MTKKFHLMFLLFTLLLAPASFALADEPSPFIADCKAKQVIAYRYSTDLNGKIKTDKWSKGEKFEAGWHFFYSGGNTVKLDDVHLPILAKTGPCLIVAEPTEAPFGAGIWVYAINLKLRKIVAAQVQTNFGLIGDGVKTRSVSLDCDFKIQ